jgi:hypothetical protein
MRHLTRAEALLDGLLIDVTDIACEQDLDMPVIVSAWLIDPALRLVEVFETAGGRPSLAETAQDQDAKVLPPFDGEIAVGSWWPPSAAPLSRTPPGVP